MFCEWSLIWWRLSLCCSFLLLFILLLTTHELGKSISLCKQQKYTWSAVRVVALTLIRLTCQRVNPKTLGKSWQLSGLCGFIKRQSLQCDRTHGYNGETLPPVWEHLQGESLRGASVLPCPFLGLSPADHLHGPRPIRWNSLKLYCSVCDAQIQETSSPSQLHLGQHLCRWVHLCHLLRQPGVCLHHEGLLLLGSHYVCPGISHGVYCRYEGMSDITVWAPVADIRTGVSIRGHHHLWIVKLHVCSWDQRWVCRVGVVWVLIQFMVTYSFSPLQVWWLPGLWLSCPLRDTWSSANHLGPSSLAVTMLSLLLPSPGSWGSAVLSLPFLVGAGNINPSHHSFEVCDMNTWGFHVCVFAGTSLRVWAAPVDPTGTLTMRTFTAAATLTSWWLRVSLHHSPSSFSLTPSYWVPWELWV